MASADGVAAERFQVVAAVAPSAAVLEGRAEVPAGWFLMGSDEHRPDEAPQHRVYLDAFSVGRYEVTNRRYARFAAAGGLPPAASWVGGSFELGRGDYPVAGLRWEEAAAYCAWAGAACPPRPSGRRRPGAPMGAPGHGGTSGTPFGPAPPSREAKARCRSAPSPPGASPYHVADMAGNLEEWVADYYQADYYAASPDRNPTGPTTVVNHVRRGGSWAGDADAARTSYRTSSHGSSPDFRAGFRCAWDA